MNARTELCDILHGPTNNYDLPTLELDKFCAQSTARTVDGINRIQPKVGSKLVYE